MTTTILVCKRCKLDMPFESEARQLNICPHCGADQHEEKSNPMALVKTFLPTLGIMTLIIGMGLYWGGYSLEVTLIKAQTVTGMADAEDHGRMAEICADLHYHTCVKESLIRKVQANPQDIEVLAELANLMIQMGDAEMAEKALRNYFERGGEDIKAKYNYAKSLRDQDKIQAAITQFERILNEKDDVLQVTVMENYIKLLVEHGEHQKASKAIADVKAKGGSVDYLNSYVTRSVASAQR